MRRSIITASCLMFLLALGSLWGQEARQHGHVGKGPLKVFILAGQSNMVGHGQSAHIKMAAMDGDTRKEFAPLMDGDGFIVRKDVWISNGGRRGGLSVGYGDSSEKVGPEIGFGWHIGELLREQVLLIKTAWGGHSLKEMFLPPSMGGPGPSYTQMVKEVREVLSNLKSYFPDYDERLGFEMTGLVYHQAWNDMIDSEQRAESPPFRLYTERQGALLRDLRKEFISPNMLMVIGECGVDGAKAGGDIMDFRKAQEATTLMEEFKKTMRLVKTAPFWDEDVRYKSDEGYHYNGNGKTYYFKGKAMALAMYDLMPKITFQEAASLLDDQLKPAYKAIKARNYPEAVAAMVAYEKHLSGQRGQIPEELFNQKEAIYHILDMEMSGAINPAVEEISHRKRTGDYYALSLSFPGLNKIFKGVPAFDQAAGDLEKQLKTKEVLAEVKIGKEFYKYIAWFQDIEADQKFSRAEMHAKKYEEHLRLHIIKKAPESPYAKAAAKAAEELKILGNPVREPQSYLSLTEVLTPR